MLISNTSLLITRLQAEREVSSHPLDDQSQTLLQPCSINLGMKADLSRTLEQQIASSGSPRHTLLGNLLARLETLNLLCLSQILTVAGFA
ncbi:unnamed protein product [Linum trigynum]|uniref:Uncharacterized protein n=1 Tax=Linum trigynum TaxID=586398 RepID=A0AAV2F117_9ROSI